ncbi:MAG: hypothetical protein IPI58_00555 [Alphaproteobacteria bacterium]|nr:MAG: hypothetical protein IPI58_00555 [Alphaproteobacteria bacterium]
MSQPLPEKPSLESVFGTPVGQLLEMDEIEIRQLLAKAELLCRWLRGVLRLKTKKGSK